MTKFKLNKFSLTLALLIVAIVWIIPMGMGIINSFKSLEEIYISFTTIPSELSFSNYIEAWDVAHFGDYLGNTFIITIGAVLLLLVLACPAGYGFAKLKFLGNKTLFMLILSGLAIPLHIVIIPLFAILDFAGMTDSYIGLIILEATYCLSFSIFVLRNFFIGIPDELRDAAKMDGCTEWKTFLLVYLPLSKPAIGTVVILTSTWIWNDFLFPLLFIYSESKRTVTQGLAQLTGEHISFWNLMLSGAVLASIIPLVIFILFQKYFTHGLTAGAVKG